MIRHFFFSMKQSENKCTNILRQPNLAVCRIELFIHSQPMYIHWNITVNYPWLSMYSYIYSSHNVNLILCITLTTDFAFVTVSLKLDSTAALRSTTLTDLLTSKTNSPEWKKKGQSVVTKRPILFWCLILSVPLDIYNTFVPSLTQLCLVGLIGVSYYYHKTTLIYR